MNTSTIQVRPAADVPWDDVARVFGTKGDPAGCWCQWFRMPRADFDTTPVADKRERMREQLQQHPSPGLVAYLDDEPVGWCALAPRGNYPLLARSPIARSAPATHGDDGLWSVTCFVVRAEHRRKGVASTLLAAAVDYARQHGAHTVEGFPVDVKTRTRVSSADLYHGSVSLFEAVGFTAVAHPSASRAVMRLEVPARAPTP